MSVNPNSFRSLQLNLSGLSTWLTILGIVWLLGAVGLGWLVKSALILIGLLLVTPFIAFLGFRWWLQRNVLQSECPVCQYTVAGINGMQTNCPSCGEPLKAEQGHFVRIAPPGTVDVEAIDVSAQQLKD